VQTIATSAGNAARSPTAEGAEAKKLSVYVHFPWCLQKCPYCDFLSIATPPKCVPHDAYASAVLRELERRARDVGSRRLETVFFGGGTPSLWKTTELRRVLDGIFDAFGSPGADVEVSVECNPSSFDADKARELVDAGVNRVSIGVQSLDAKRLEFLGRLHDAAGGLAAVEAALRTDGLRVSADLIFGVAGESPEDAVREALRVADLGVTHLSAYALTIEPGTQFGARARKGRLPLLGEDLVAESFTAVHEALTSRGFEHYEVSNFAKGGHRARHNLAYWLGDDYLGLGTGAWGTVEVGAKGASERFRYRNTTLPDRYLATEPTWDTADLRRGAPGELVLEYEPISGATAFSERLMLGLRLADGLDVESAARDLGVDPWPIERRRAVDRLEARGRIRKDGPRLAIPHDAWLFADGTIAEII